MKPILCFLAFLCSITRFFAQVDLIYFGLENQQLTSLDINYGIIAAGTDRNGVHWQYEPQVTDTGWNKIRLDSTVLAVYPHKSGPIGWAISAGIQGASAQPPYVFCSYLGEEFEDHSIGIDPEMTTAIVDIDGFPDPTICGETYAVADRVLYRRYFGDTIWHPVYNATIEGYLQTVKVRQEYPGVVLAGGADGFSGILLIKSLDFGETWENISPFGMVYDLDFSGDTADVIFAVALNKIFRTTDGGANWLPVYEDTVGFHLTEILYDEATKSVYAAGGTAPGEKAVLLISHDFGEHWEYTLPDNLGTILGLEEGSDDWIYIITRNEGVYRFRNTTSGIEDTDVTTTTTISLKQNTPNPFSDLTRIDYSLSETTHVVVKVLNISGEELITLVNDRLPRGEHCVYWNASQMHEGVYLIVLEAEGQRAFCQAARIGG